MIAVKIHRLHQEEEMIDGVGGILITTATGQQEILPGHEPFFAVLTPPEITLLGSERRTLPLPTEGFISIEKDQCQIWIS